MIRKMWGRRRVRSGGRGKPGGGARRSARAAVLVGLAALSCLPGASTFSPATALPMLGACPGGGTYDRIGRMRRYSLAGDAASSRSDLMRARAQRDGEGPSVPGGWVSAKDDASGDAYYNERTGKNTCESPAAEQAEKISVKESNALAHPGFVFDALDRDGDGKITREEY